jgi:2-hydroxy-3-keto-5-methylthiopentenyl-1-phosphate phosphatase
MTKFLIFSDFDGFTTLTRTITTRDTGTVLIDMGMGIEKRKALDKKILEGELTFRKAVEEMWNAVSMSWEEALVALENIEFDPHFVEFHDWVLEQRMELTILSRYGLLTQWSR